MSGNFRGSYSWKKKRKEIKKLYNSKCAVCGSSDNCQAHHIIPLAVAPQLKLENSNIILLCANCHSLAHNGILNQSNLIQKVKR